MRATDVAKDAAEQELTDVGAVLRGTYPPNEETLAAFTAWRATPG